jgi:hypothetical protein
MKVIKHKSLEMKIFGISIKRHFFYLYFEPTSGRSSVKMLFLDILWEYVGIINYECVEINIV